MGLPSTREIRGRKITKTGRGFTGTRIYIGPKDSIASDVPQINASWPTADTVADNWTTTSLIVTDIDIEYDIAQTDAQATIKYATADGGGVAQQEIGTEVDSLDVVATSVDLAAVPGASGLISRYKDVNGKSILVEEFEASLATCILTKTRWYETEPSFAGCYLMVNSVNAGNFEGAAAEYFLCTGAKVNQIELNKWEGNFEFTLSPYLRMSDSPHWNNCQKHKDGTVMPLYPQIDFASRIVAL